MQIPVSHKTILNKLIRFSTVNLYFHSDANDEFRRLGGKDIFPLFVRVDFSKGFLFTDQAINRSIHPSN